MSNISNSQPFPAVHAGKSLLQTPSVSHPDPCRFLSIALEKFNPTLLLPMGYQRSFSTLDCLSPFFFHTDIFFPNTLNISFLLWLSGHSLAGSLPSASAFTACQGGYSLPGCHHPLVKISSKHSYTFFHQALRLGRDILQTAAKLYHYLPSKLLFKFSFAIRLKKKPHHCHYTDYKSILC